jgi:DNA-binding XRE family transcriptional regulator
VSIQKLEINGKRFVLLEEASYKRLCRVAVETEVNEPPLPKAAADGTRPALETMRALLAQGLIRDRRAAGLTQQRLAKLAGVRQETISRIESGKHTPSVRTMQKIDRALSRRER